MGLDGDVMQGDVVSRPVSLRRLTGADCDARNALCRAIAFPPIANGKQKLSLSFCPAPPVMKGGIAVRATVNGHPVALHLGWSHIRRVTGETLEILRKEDAALILEERLAPWFDAFEAATGLTLQLDRIDETDDMTSDAKLGLRFAIEGFAMVFECAPSPEAVAALQSARLARYSNRGANPAVALSCVLLETRLPRARINALEVGSGIFLGTDPETASLEVQGQFAAPVSRADGKLTLTGPFRAIPSLGVLSMSEPSKPAAEFDDMELRLQVRAGEALITLSDLRNLAPGSVLSLPGNDGAVVDLLVNDRTIGRGQLVEIPGGRAVEITDIF